MRRANAALALLDAHAEDYGLLITDLSLPDMSGDELMNRARLRAPHLPANHRQRLSLRAPPRRRRVPAETFFAELAGGSRQARAQGLRAL